MSEESDSGKPLMRLEGFAEVCTGCGSSKTLEELRALGPAVISCCPERDMRDAKYWALRAERAEAELKKAQQNALTSDKGWAEAQRATKYWRDAYDALNARASQPTPPPEDGR